MIKPGIECYKKDSSGTRCYRKAEVCGTSNGVEKREQAGTKRNTLLLEELDSTNGNKLKNKLVQDGTKQYKREQYDKTRNKMLEEGGIWYKMVQESMIV